MKRRCAKSRNEILECALGSPADGDSVEGAELRKVVENLRALPRYSPSRDLAPLIAAEIRREALKREPSIVVFRRMWVAAAAALLCLATGAILLLRPGRIGESHSESMIAASTGWLLNAQEEDGSWDPVRWGGRSEYRVALTGLAMMALAGAGRSAEISDACGRAAGYIIANQGEDGSLGPAISGCLYNHGIATMALLTSVPGRPVAVSDAANGAIEFMISAQSPEGAWGYANASDGADNTSITVWQVRALMEARSAGRKGLDAALGRAMRWLTARVDGKGRFGYERAGDSGADSGALTAMGASCVMDPRVAGMDLPVRKNIRAALAFLPEDIGVADFYRDFFLVDALQKAGDGEALALANGIRRNMTSRHAAAGNQDGSWTPDERWGSVGGKIYSTALAALSLDSRRRM